MKYLYRGKKNKYVAHIWIDDDTACTMWSTGGLKRNLEGWTWDDSYHTRRLCKTCLHNIKKGSKKKPRKKKRVIKNKGIPRKDFGYVQSDSFLTDWPWRTLRYEVLQKHGRRCMCCGATPDDGVTVICVDHIKPRYTHPALALDPANLQVLCAVCNQGKGAWDNTDHRENKTNYEAENVFQIELARKATETQ